MPDRTDALPRTDYHAKAWSNPPASETDHTWERAGCPGCAFITVVRSEARADLLAVMKSAIDWLNHGDEFAAVAALRAASPRRSAYLGELADILAIETEAREGYVTEDNCAASQRKALALARAELLAELLAVAKLYRDRHQDDCLCEGCRALRAALSEEAHRGR